METAVPLKPKREICCPPVAEADRGGEHAGSVAAAVLAARGDAALLHSRPSGREDPVCGRVGADV